MWFGDCRARRRLAGEAYRLGRNRVRVRHLAGKDDDLVLFFDRSRKLKFDHFHQITHTSLNFSAVAADCSQN